jgi:hypothetical protein
MAMVDNRVLSFIVSDAARDGGSTNVLADIKKLPSRSSVKDSEIERKVDILLSKAKELMDSSDEEDETFAEDLFVKEQSSSKDESQQITFRKFKKSLLYFYLQILVI